MYLWCGAHLSTGHFMVWYLVKHMDNLPYQKVVYHEYCCYMKILFSTVDRLELLTSLPSHLQLVQDWWHVGLIPPC